MLLRATLLFLAVIAGCVALLVKALFSPTAIDREAYLALVQESARMRDEAPFENISQRREGSEREFWGGGTRPYVRLSADTSTLKLAHREGKLELVDELSTIQGERYNGALHKLHTFSAERGAYAFPSHQFTSEEVSLIAFAEGGEPLFRVEARRGEIPSTVAHAPLAFHFDEEVRLVSEGVPKRCATADHLLYQIEGPLLVLKSDAPSKVLFWQEGMAMAAPEVRVMNERVQAVGALSATFNLEEKNYFERLFAPYIRH